MCVCKLASISLTSLSIIRSWVVSLLVSFSNSYYHLQLFRLKPISSLFPAVSCIVYWGLCYNLNVREQLVRLSKPTNYASSTCMYVTQTERVLTRVRNPYMLFLTIHIEQGISKPNFKKTIQFVEKECSLSR